MSRYMRIEKKLRAGFGVSALLLTLVAGCAEQPTMILIRGAALSDSSCVLSTDPAGFLTEGVLDVSLASGYVLAPNLQNVAPSSSTVGAKSTGGAAGGGAVFNNLSVEGNNVIITEAQVDFELITAAAVPAQVSSIFRGYDLPIGGAVIEPNGGKATFGMSVLNSTHVAALQQVVSPGNTLTVMVKLKLFGVTTSDTEVESNTFNFPILVCNGCLAPTDCTVEATNSNHCVMPGQDFVFCPPAVDVVVP